MEEASGVLANCGMPLVVGVTGVASGAADGSGAVREDCRLRDGVGVVGVAATLADDCCACC